MGSRVMARVGAGVVRALLVMEVSSGGGDGVWCPLLF